MDFKGLTKEDMIRRLERIANNPENTKKNIEEAKQLIKNLKEKENGEGDE